MKTRLLIIILLTAVVVPVTSFAQNMGDGPDKLWLSACPVGTGTECNQSKLFHNAISAPFSQSDSVAIGTIIQKESMGKNSILYSIDVDFYLKNYQPFDLLTVTLDDAPELQKFPDVLYYNSPVFNEGDLVFVYLIKNDGHYELLPESFALDKQEGRGPPPTILLTKSPTEDVFLQGEKIIVSGEIRKMELVKAVKNGEKLDVKLTLHKPYDENTVFFSDLMDADADGSYNYSLDTSNISPGDYTLEVNYGPSSMDTEITINFNSIYWSPLKQFNSGIPIDEIECKDGLVEVIKISNNSPACVSLETKAKLIQRGWADSSGNILKQRTAYSEPEPRKISDSEMQLYNAKRALESSYYENANLGPLKINDVIVGFGIENDALIMDVLYRYSTSSEMDIVKKKIRDIVGDEIKIEYVPFKTPPSVIEMSMPYHWNKYLHKNNVEFVPANTSYGNNDDGIGNGTILCSPLVAPNGTEFYIASTVDVEPFLITETFIDQEKPDFCRKTWKTDVILEEPNRIISLWLAIGQGKIPN